MDVCVGDIDFPLSTIFLLDFRTVPTLWYYLTFNFIITFFLKVKPTGSRSSSIFNELFLSAALDFRRANIKRIIMKYKLLHT